MPKPEHQTIRPTKADPAAKAVASLCEERAARALAAKQAEAEAQAEAEQGPGLIALAPVFGLALWALLVVWVFF